MYSIRTIVAAVCLALALHAGAGAAQAQQRSALLIGNQGYSGRVQALKNPHNDIRMVGAALQAVGFKVTSLTDAGRRQMLSAVKDFAAELAKGGPSAIGFLYYSGHGVARPEDRANYLIPIDLKDTGNTDFWFDAVKLDDLLGELERAAPQAAHFVVFDACRDELRLPYRSAAKGFEAVAERNGMYIAFATALGAVALDEARSGAASGPYAEALAAELVKPGQDHLQLFQNVKEGVFAATARRQVPWERSGLLRRVYFAAEKPAPVVQPSRAEVAQFCQAIATNPSIAVVQSLLDTYKGTPMAACAQARLDELKKQLVAVAVPPAPAPVPSKPAQPAVAVTPAPPPAPCVETLVGTQRRCLKPKESFKDCPECPEMVVIPAGEFMMGSPADEEARESNEGPVRKVTIAKPFAVGKFEATFVEWDACVAAGGCKHKPNDYGWGRGKDPVIDVSWDDAKEYIAWLSTKTSRTYRLLTEAEWEYAARAGTTTPFSTGRTITTDQANFHGNSTYGGSAKGVFRQKTIEVGSLNKPNAFGLHDMHGNVWEWVQDCYQDTYAGAPSDGRAVADTSSCSRVLRGGSWDLNPQGLRSAARNWFTPGYRLIVLGFRVARTL
jgi:formylglycine-generating enzyme required for sulfatase activity